MLNHIHLIVTSPDISGFLRDFKRFTSTQLRKNLESTEPKVLALFINSDSQYRFWQNTNSPKKIESLKFYLQKLHYIHENPVRKDYVCRPEYWKWSSANPFSEIAVNFL